MVLTASCVWKPDETLALVFEIVLQNSANQRLKITGIFSAVTDTHRGTEHLFINAFKARGIHSDLNAHRNLIIR